MTDSKSLLLDMFDAAIEAAQPKHCIPLYLPPEPKGRAIVIGAGKAAAEMARVVEQHWVSKLEGMVVTRYGYGVPCSKIQIIEAAHPVPDANGLAASQQMLDMVSNLSSEDTVLCLISGGGSSLLPLPLPGITLEDKQLLNKELLKSGASISEMNCVRRHLSAIKGGRLAAACYPAKLITLAISDVPGDHPADIASGPTIGDITTCQDALSIIERYKIKVSESILTILKSGVGETIKPDDLLIAKNEFHLIATPQYSLEVAAEKARLQGITPYILGDTIEGNACDLGKVLGAITQSTILHQHPFNTPCVLLSGGETTVVVKGNGRGGRNVEFLLSLAITLKGLPNVYALAGDTDGVDGAEEVAGAILTPDTLARAWQLGINPQESLDNNDAHTFFKALNDQVITGPTLTNVNDFRAILIE